MELHQLDCVMAVAKYKNFSQAANEVAITTASISQQVKKLEEELGVALFIRTTRSVQLTAAGSEFIENAKRIKADILQTNAVMQKYVVGEHGQLSIGSLPAFRAFGISSMVSAFQKSYPKIAIEIHEAECMELYPLLSSGKIDAAILTAFDKYPGDKTGLDSYPLFTDELVLLVNKSHPLAARKSIKLREAAQERFISFPKESGLYLDVRDACHTEGFEPSIAYTAQYVDTCEGLVAENMGVVIVSSRTATNTMLKNIAVVPIKPGIERTTSLVFLKKNKKSPVLLNLINFFAAHYIIKPH